MRWRKKQKLKKTSMRSKRSARCTNALTARSKGTSPKTATKGRPTPMQAALATQVAKVRDRQMVTVGPQLIATPRSQTKKELTS